MQVDMGAAFRRAGKFMVQNRRGIISAGLAILGDAMMPTFGDRPSLITTAIWLTGEAGLLAFGNKTLGFAASYGLFGVGMYVLRDSVGVNASEYLRTNLLFFAIVDAVWAARYPIGLAATLLHRHGPKVSERLYVKAEKADSQIMRSSCAFVADALKKHSDSHNPKSACRRLIRVSNAIMPIAGFIATFLHIPGTIFAERTGVTIDALKFGSHSLTIPPVILHALGDPTNVIMLAGHGLWMTADAVNGRLKKFYNQTRRFIHKHRAPTYLNLRFTP